MFSNALSIFLTFSLCIILRLFMILDNPENVSKILLASLAIISFQFLAAIFQKKIISFLNIFFVTFVIYLFITTPTFLGYEAKTIGSPSNEPTLNYGDIVVARNFNLDLDRGRVIRFNNRDESFQKRIHGVPGDVILICNRDVYVNGVQRSAYNNWQPEELTKDKACASLKKIIHLRNDEYFMVGDNKFNSFDSRDFGVVKKENITAQALYKFNKGDFSEVVYLKLFESHEDL
jgi:signal peptidase I